MNPRGVLRVRPAVAIGALVGRLLALAPGVMPRSTLIAVAAGVLLTLVGMGVGAAAGAVRNRLVDDRPDPVTGVWLAVGLMASGVAVGVAARHEIAVRAALDVPSIGIGWVLAVTTVPMIAAVLAVTIRPRVWAATVLVGAVALTALRTPGPADAARPDVPDSPAMIYSLLTEPGSVQTRADRLVDRWVDAGGLDRRAVVVAVPTGSGWVDAGTVDGVQRRFDDSVTVLALQYDDVASWKAFVSSPDAAGDSAIAVLRAVDRRLDAVPPQRRPRVYLVGQSLGAVGADAARAWAVRTGAHVDGTVLAGPPAGTVEALPSCARRVVLANRDDPVTAFSEALLWRPADRTLDAEPTDDGDRQPWLPVVSMIGTVLDLPGALDVPTGHGHRYGVEQGLAIGRLPAGC
ncbi:alpha/beta-hydrolase family protein [Gordonia phthalatica]|uniref:Alpha/beta-hydrolase catalytic domain-containing protein n=1 Tax=Gordonia phthalatica TaxID=1136941 RepID=A0A0N9N9K6_9ACTN|nr:alpha/beta-hydrolase family protein [Gordonia phthalatica]ALG84101.1 hypothetical protein ACH46_05745 [Gordonia phthalatica]